MSRETRLQGTWATAANSSQVTCSENSCAETMKVCRQLVDYRQAAAPCPTSASGQSSCSPPVYDSLVWQDASPHAGAHTPLTLRHMACTEAGLSPTCPLDAFSHSRSFLASHPAMRLLRGSSRQQLDWLSLREIPTAQQDLVSEQATQNPRLLTHDP